MSERVYDNVAVGARLKSIREFRNLTQEYVSDKVSVNTQHISDIERGKVGLSIGSLIKLCEVLEASADYILFGNDGNRSGNPIYDLLENMSDKDKSFVEDFILLYARRK